MKNNSPGESKINKAILVSLPENSITLVQWLFKHSIFLGYFPRKFKTAIIKLIPKPITNHSNPLNYRPISLLEVTSKNIRKNNQQKNIPRSKQQDTRNAAWVQSGGRNGHSHHLSIRNNSTLHGQETPVLLSSSRCIKSFQ